MTKSVICLRLLDTIMRWLADYPSTEKTSNTVQSPHHAPVLHLLPYHPPFKLLPHSILVPTMQPQLVPMQPLLEPMQPLQLAPQLLPLLLLSYHPPYHLPHQNLYLWRCQSEPICVNFSFSATLQNDFMQTLISHKFTNMAQIDGKGVIFVWWWSLWCWSWWQSDDAIRPNE